MTTLREAAQQALDFISSPRWGTTPYMDTQVYMDAAKLRDDLRAALEQPSREWRGLKKWEINDGLEQLPTEDVCSWSFRKGVEFAEAALKERNA